VESVLSVYGDYTGRPAIRTDGTVDPDLIRQYRESAYLSLVWMLLDPMFYRSAGAFGADMKQDHGLMRSSMLVENERMAWTYGTQFHQSPLGYELYLHNYLRLNGRLYSFYMKGGRPYGNIGVGVQIPGLIENDNFMLGVACDLWDQDLFGRGAALTLDAEYRLGRNLGLLLNGTWKDRGYLIGKRIGNSLTLLAGFSYRF